MRKRVVAVMIRAGLGCAGLWCALAGAGLARAAGPTSFYDSAGFEPPRFTTEPLWLSDGGRWQRYDDTSGAGASGSLSAGNDAVIRASAGNGGTGTAAVSGQGVMMTRLGSTSQWTPGPVGAALTPATRVVQIEWDQRLTLGPNSPFYGVEAYNGASPLALVGLNGTTGSLVLANPGGAPLDASAAFTTPGGTWHHFQLALHFASGRYAVAIDGQVKDSGRSFIAANTQFTDAALTTFGLIDDTSSTAGTLAGFDNYRVTAIPEGDANGDGQVDVSDLGVLAQHWQANVGLAGPAAGDFNLDGTVDVSDLGILAQYWNAGTSGTANGTMSGGASLRAAMDSFPAFGSAVPEPASIALVAVGVALSVSSRRRRH